MVGIREDGTYTMSTETRVTASEIRDASVVSHILFPHQIRHGLVARIAGSHPAGPGSIPGAGKYVLPNVPRVLSVS